MNLTTSSKMAILAFVVFLILVLELPFYSASEQIKQILTVSTFLFGIFAGFVIASRMTRYTRFRELLTNETGNLIAIYENSKAVEEKFSKKIADLIDKYLVDGFLYESHEYHKKTEASFYSIFDEIRNFKLTNKEQESFLGAMGYTWRHMPQDREELYLLAKDKISFLLNSIIFILAGIILFCLYYIRVDAIYSSVITVLLSTSVVLVLFLIKDLDRLRVTDAAMSYGIYFRVFDLIGKPRLFTSHAVKRGHLKLPTKFIYRYGIIAKDEDRKNYYKQLFLVDPTKKTRTRKFLKWKR